MLKMNLNIRISSHQAIGECYGRVEEQTSKVFLIDQGHEYGGNFSVNPSQDKYVRFELWKYEPQKLVYSWGIPLKKIYEQKQYLSLQSENLKLLAIPEMGAQTRQRVERDHNIDKYAYQSDGHLGISGILKERINELHSRQINKSSKKMKMTSSSLVFPRVYLPPQQISRRNITSDHIQCPENPQIDSLYGLAEIKKKFQRIRHRN